MRLCQQLSNPVSLSDDSVPKYRQSKNRGLTHEPLSGCRSDWSKLALIKVVCSLAPRISLASITQFYDAIC